LHSEPDCVTRRSVNGAQTPVYLASGDKPAFSRKANFPEKQYSSGYCVARVQSKNRNEQTYFNASHCHWVSLGARVHFLITCYSRKKI